MHKLEYIINSESITSIDNKLYQAYLGWVINNEKLNNIVDHEPINNRKIVEGATLVYPCIDRYRDYILCTVQIKPNGKL